MKKIMMFMTFLSLILLTGCSYVTLSDKEEAMIAEYAASLLLKYDANYQYKLLSREELNMISEEETKPSNPVDSDQPSTEKPTNSNIGNITLEEALKLEGFTLKYIGYEVVGSYPSEINNNSLFVMRALEGTKLFIMRFELKNITDNSIELNMMEKDVNFRGVVNNDNRYNAQLTLLLNALNTYQGTVKSNESKELVLVFQVKDGLEKNIKNISLNVISKDSNYNIIMQ